jgi:hypothetical protein
VPPRDDDNAPRSFLGDLFAQLFADGTRIDAGRYCAYDAFLGFLLLGGAIVLRVSGPPDLLGAGGFAFVVASAVALLAGLVVPLVRPQRVPALLVAHGAIVLALTVAFALACAAWAVGDPATRPAFRYFPGLIVVGSTYGAALSANFGPARVRPRRWRVAGFVLGLALEVTVAVLVVATSIRD